MKIETDIKLTIGYIRFVFFIAEVATFFFNDQHRERKIKSELYIVQPVELNRIIDL